MINFLRQLFCKHYYQLSKDNDEITAYFLNAHGYHSKKSTCIFCGKTVEHD